MIHVSVYVQALYSAWPGPTNDAAAERSDNTVKPAPNPYLRLRIYYDSAVILKKFEIHLELISLLALLSVSTLSRGETIEIPPLATDEEVARSVEVFEEWTAAYQRKDFEAQYKLVHPRIQKWKTRRMWKKAMSKSLHKNGRLNEYEPVFVSAIAADKVPCTEMGHCYRKDMQVVIIVLNSHYEKIGDMEKEYVLMTHSEDGWRFGGGTFLNRPFGETLGILDRLDEKRYEYNGIDKSQSKTY